MTTHKGAADKLNGILGRSARPLGQLWQAPLFCAGLLAIAVVATASPLAPRPDDPSKVGRTPGRDTGHPRCLPGRIPRRSASDLQTR